MFGGLASTAVHSQTRITLEYKKKNLRINDKEIGLSLASGGGGGIRTHGGLSPTSVFKTGALNRSATPPVPTGLAGDVRF